MESHNFQFTQDDLTRWNKLIPNKVDFLKRFNGTHIPSICNFLIGYYGTEKPKQWQKEYRQFIDQLTDLPLYSTLVELLEPGEDNYMVNNGYDSSMRQLYFHHLMDYPDIPRDNRFVQSLLPDYKSQNDGAELVPTVIAFLDGLIILPHTPQYRDMAKDCMDYLITARRSEKQVIPLLIQERAKNYLYGMEQYYPDIAVSHAYTHVPIYSHTLKINIATFMHQYGIENEHLKNIESNLQKFCLDFCSYSLINEVYPQINLTNVITEQKKNTLTCLFLTQTQNSFPLLIEFLDQVVPLALDMVANSIDQDLDFSSLIRTTLFQTKLESQLAPALKGRLTNKI